MTKSNSTVDPTARDKYLLEVTAGPSYNPSTHTQIPVNSPSATKIDSDLVTAWLRVRIKNYHGLPHNSPSSSPYFEHPQHTSDRYSIAFSFVPKQDIAGTDAVMGFDYDHSIKHQLPPGFRAAMRIVTSLLDPGLYSDPYSDEPYLYGPALSSFFALHIGETTDRVSAAQQLATLDDSAASVILEGASGSGIQIRESLSLPSGWKQRRKNFLGAAALEGFTFEKGRMYHADFFNPHLDFADFALRLPGLKISVARYVDEKTHHLRFVLKDRGLEKPLFVVFFKLLFGRELEERLEDEQEDGLAREGGGDAGDERAGPEIEDEGQAQIDDMDDSTVENYLQSRHGSAR
ncbi:DUF1769-domain-containing protein [Pyrenochaeta sp. DS3sAY3a]|nr:DUF1769-domain-containing protein [Pyrenochaeta sp. DS3sAY3a]